MITRQIGPSLLVSAKGFPLIGLVGPRQSGKTTLTRQLFSEYKYVNLEELDARGFATQDPRGFLKRYSQKVILDEVQRVPELFSYLQVKVDEDKIAGQYILTGSQHFLMMSSITQSLAGRIALFQLYPLSYSELTEAKLAADDVSEQIYKGGYPRLYDEPISIETWLNGYVQTYLDRDVCTLSQIDNLGAFEKFLRICAGRTGQILNLSVLGSDVGVSHNTIKAWISLLETSGTIFLLKPYFANVSKRLIKSSKLYFVDTGLACRLLGIETAKQLPTHPLYGSLFETWIITEYVKNCFNRGKDPQVYYWRDRQGGEADLLLVRGDRVVLGEIKSSQTIATDVFGKLRNIGQEFNQPVEYVSIFGGQEGQDRTQGRVLSWRELELLDIR